jgi:hypothetical protein
MMNWKKVTTTYLTAILFVLIAFTGITAALPVSHVNSLTPINSISQEDHISTLDDVINYNLNNGITCRYTPLDPDTVPPVRPQMTFRHYYWAVGLCR